MMEPVAAVGAVAVKRTDWPAVEGLTDEDNAIAGVAFVTVTTVAGDVAELLFASAGVVAVMGSVPTGRVVIVIVEAPLMIGALPMGVAPL